MSFDAENRNNINNYPVNNYSRNNVVIQNHIIKCSFCNCYGHNITSCNDSRITDFERECQMSKAFCEWTENPRTTFKEWLIAYAIEVDVFIVRAFAISKCHCRSNLVIDILIDGIVTYMYDDEEPNVASILFPDILAQDETTFYTDLEAIMSLLFLQNEDINSSNISETRFNITAIVEQIDEKQGAEICDCAICYEESVPKKNFVTLNCQHQFCKDCFKSSVKNTPYNKYIPTCALCRGDITEIKIHDESIKDELAEFCTN